MKKTANTIGIVALSVLLQAGFARSAFASGFNFVYKDQIFAVSDSALAGWEGEQLLGQSKILNPVSPSNLTLLLTSVGLKPPGQDFETIYSYRLDDIYDYLQNINQKIDSPESEPELVIANGRATSFTPPETGQTLDVYHSSLAALNALQVSASSSQLSVLENLPQTSLAQTNDLGISTLIGRGVSSFNGSPNNRRHNIAVGIEKFQGIIIPPGAQFSFDDSLGPVTAEAGFYPELVIDNGTTLPELGGGLCQVSTTTFRAAMDAGLPITARRNHAYAVSYYSPQGTDATIYPGSADLKFTNDTPGSILIWPYEQDSNTLVFDFYGSSDGRQVTLEKPVVFDRKPDGSMKATWTRTITNNGTTTTDTFKSVYQSPALFHKRETYVSSAGAQTLTIPPKALN